MSANSPRPGRTYRPLYLIGGLALTGVGFAGYFLPVLPGTVFLILAAACFARSSPRLESWLVGHPRFGPGIQAWRDTGAIPRPAKLIAILSMAASFAIMWVAQTPVWARWLAGAVLLGCALFVASRPAGPRSKT
jgi:uncharacterized membrane protein YbaN (DUF454 family)